MKKNNAAFVIVTTFALIMISTSIQGMEEHAKKIVLTKDDISYLIPINKDILQIHITASPQEHDPKSITTRYYGPSIMTALYVKYKNGAQFAGTTCCQLPKFLSNFSKEYDAVEALCREATQGNNLAHIERIKFWYLKPQNLPDEDLKIYDKNKKEISKLLHDHFLDKAKSLFRNEDINEIKSWINSTLTEETTDYYVFGDTHKRAQLKVTLYPTEGALELNDDKIKL